MPYKSKKHRGWMHVNKPALARKWDKKYGGKIRPNKRKRKRGKK